MADAADLTIAMARTSISSDSNNGPPLIHRSDDYNDDSDEVIFLGETPPPLRAPQTADHSNNNGDSEDDVEFVGMERAADPAGRERRLSAVENIPPQVSLPPQWYEPPDAHGVGGPSNVHPVQDAPPVLRRTQAPVPRSPPPARGMRRNPLPLFRRTPERPAPAAAPRGIGRERRAARQVHPPPTAAPRRRPLPLIRSPSRRPPLRATLDRPAARNPPAGRWPWAVHQQHQGRMPQWLVAPSDPDSRPLTIVVPSSGRSTSRVAGPWDNHAGAGPPGDGPEGGGEAGGSVSSWGSVSSVSSPGAESDSGGDMQDSDDRWDDVSSVSSPDSETDRGGDMQDSDDLWDDVSSVSSPDSETGSDDDMADDDLFWDDDDDDDDVGNSGASSLEMDIVDDCGSSGDAASAGCRSDAAPDTPAVARLPILPGRRRLAKVRHVHEQRTAVSSAGEASSDDGGDMSDGHDTHGESGEGPPADGKPARDGGDTAETAGAGGDMQQDAEVLPPTTSSPDAAAGETQSILYEELIPSVPPAPVQRQRQRQQQPVPAATGTAAMTVRTERLRRVQDIIARLRSRREASMEVRALREETEAALLATERAEAERMRRHRAAIESSDDDDDDDDDNDGGYRARAERHCSLRHSPPNGVDLGPGESGSAWTRDGWARTGHLSSYLRRYRVVAHVPHADSSVSAGPLRAAYAALLDGPAGRRDRPPPSVPPAGELWAACRALDHAVSGLLRPYGLRRTWLLCRPLGAQAPSAPSAAQAAELERADRVMGSAFYAMYSDGDARRREALAWLLCRYARAMHRARLARLMRSITYDDVLRALRRCGVASVVDGAYRREFMSANASDAAARQWVMPAEPPMAPLPRRRTRYTAAQRQAADRGLAALDCVLEFLRARTGDGRGAAPEAPPFVPAPHAVPLLVALFEMDASVDGCGARRSLADVARALLAHHYDGILDGLRGGALLRRFPAATIELAGLLTRSALAQCARGRAVLRYVCILFLSRDLAVPFPGADGAGARPAESQTRETRGAQDFFLAVLHELERGVRESARSGAAGARRRWMLAMALGRTCVAVRLCVAAFAHASDSNRDMFGGGGGGGGGDAAAARFGWRAHGALDRLRSVIWDLQAVPQESADRLDALSAIGSLKTMLNARNTRGQTTQPAPGQEEWLWR